MLVHRLTQPRAHHVGVDLGGRDVRMAQHRLDATQVRAALQQVSGETVADHVRGQMVKQPGLPPMDAQQFPERLPRQATAARRHKEITAGTTF